MGTRATYLFKASSEYDRDICLYNHYDNYPEGAVHFIYNAFKNGPDHRRGPGQVTAESMIRGNPKFEITKDHDAHGDTDYRYTFEGKILTIYKREWDHQGPPAVPGWDPEWTLFWTGKWTKFINEYGINSFYSIPDFEPVRTFHLGYQMVTMTQSMVKERLAKEAMILGTWAANGNGARGSNWDNQLKIVKILIDMKANYHWEDNKT